METDVPQQLTFGPFCLDLRQERLWQGEQELELRPKAFAVLRYLVEHQGRLVTKEELLKTLWAGTYVSDTVLKVCVRKIREVLKDEAATPRFIETIRWRGYRWVAPLSITTQPVISSQYPVASRKQGEVNSQESASLPFFPSPHSALSAQHPVLVGREAELTQLQRWLETALTGERQVLFVTGEAGIGKTTLVDTFLERQETRDWRLATAPQASSLKPQAFPIWLGRGQCLEQYGGGEAYLPILEALGQLCRGPGRDRVIQVLSQYAPTWVVQMPGLVPEAELAALQRKVAGATRERMLREMAEALAVLTQEHGFVLVLEDLHWSDRSTLECLAYLAQRREQARLLLIGTYRPAEMVVASGHPLKGIKQELQAHGLCAELQLELLTEGDVEEYLAKRFDGEAFPAELATLIHPRTDGNALFMVNLVEYYVQQGLLAETDGHWHLHGTITTAAEAVPESLRQLIAKQIEGLRVEEQRVLEVASVAGPEFVVASVAAVLKREPEAVEEVCEALARTGHFLHGHGIVEWPDGTVSGQYAFRHALYQSVLYERIAEARRVRLHRGIGEYEERVYGERAKEIAAELAMHFERGHDDRRAVRYLQHAGQHALRRSAYHEAISSLAKGVSLLQAWPDTSERAQQELQLQVALGPAFMSTQGFASPAAEKAYTRARELCQQLGETSALCSALFGLWRFYNGRAESQPARESGEQMLRVAESVQDPTLLLGAHDALGITTFHCGELARSRTHLEQAETLYSPSQHATLSALYGIDLGVSCKAYLALALGFLGYPQQAGKKAHEAIALARSLSHPISLVSALFFALLGHQYRREEHLVQERSAELIALCQEYGFRHWLAHGMIMQGWVLADQGQTEQIEQGLAILRTLGSRVGLSTQLGLLADSYRKVGKPEEGLKTVDEALTFAQQSGEQAWEAELYRLKGELMLAQEGKKQKATGKRQKAKIPSPQPLEPSTQEAEACFHKAIEIARHQQAKWLELRAAVCLARLWQSQGKITESRQRLAEIYDWFTEEFETQDLQDAKMLLEELGQA